MVQQLRVGFLSSQNYFDRNAWSGILYYMYQALSSRGIHLVNLGEPKKPYRWRNILNRLWKNTPSEIGSDRYIIEQEKFASKVQRQLIKMPCDVIFAPVGKREVTFLETHIPIISLSDVTFKLIQNFYQLELNSKEIEWESKQELTAINKSSKVVYPSEWAANSAICDYHAEADKIEVIPFGANLDNPPLTNEVLVKEKNSHCRLLFVGKDWDRKGGNIAFQTLLSLNRIGFDAELIVIGCVPPDEITHEKLTSIPYLNKNIPQQREQLNEIFMKSHFFIFPTRADCSPIVICEANAFGIPAIATDVGGIPTIIKNGKNGYMLPLSASSDDYANLIVKIFSDKVGYDNLVRSSRGEYDMRLNWNKWAESIHPVFTSVIDKKHSQNSI